MIDEAGMLLGGVEVQAIVDGVNTQIGSTRETDMELGAGYVHRGKSANVLTSCWAQVGQYVTWRFVKAGYRMTDVKVHFTKRGEEFYSEVVMHRLDSPERDKTHAHAKGHHDSRTLLREELHGTWWRAISSSSAMRMAIDEHNRVRFYVVTKTDERELDTKELTVLDAGSFNVIRPLGSRGTDDFVYYTFAFQYREAEKDVMASFKNNPRLIYTRKKPYFK